MKAGFVIERHTHPRGLHWVIFDWASRRCLSSDVRFAPKATEGLHCSEMTRWANGGLSNYGITPAFASL
jgi:hypothetical protein